MVHANALLSKADNALLYVSASIFPIGQEQRQPYLRVCALIDDSHFKAIPDLFGWKKLGTQDGLMLFLGEDVNIAAGRVRVLVSGMPLGFA